MKRYTYFKVSLLLYSACMYLHADNLSAQVSQPREMPVTPTPEVASLLRNVMNPVDLYTGTVNIQIPLYEVQYKGMQVPISLNYRTSGIKVHDLPTWVGLGWDLVCGGKITRIVRGKPDERGFCAGDGKKLSQNYHTWSTNKMNEIIENDEVDFEPDLFFFQIPGNSGAFVVNQDRDVYTIPYSNLKINWIYTNNYFIVSDAKGWKYTFGQNAKEEITVTSYDKKHENGKTESYVSVWYLEKIENAEGHSITFSYMAGGNLNFLDYNIQSKLTINPTAQGNKVEKETIPYKQTSASVTPRYLSQITADQTTIKFNSSTGNTGLNNLRKLDNIKIYVLGQLIKTIEMSHSTFYNDYLKLDNVKEVAGNKNLLIASFSYNGTNLPKRDTKDFDHWGYYNGARNTSYRPSFTYNYVAECPGASREPSFYYTKANILTKVWNNLGGYTEYFYGANKVYKNGLVDEIVGGLRIDSIKQCLGNSDNDSSQLVTKYEYVNENSTCSGTKYAEMFLYVPPRVNPDPRAKVEVYCPAMRLNNVFDLNGSPVAYSQVKEIHPNGSYSVYEYTSHGDSGCTDIPVDYSILQGILNEGWQYLATPTSMFWKRGLLKSKKDYDKAGRLTGQLDNTYSVDANLKTIVPGYCPLTIIFQGGAMAYARFQYQWQVYPVLLMSSVTTENSHVKTKTEYLYDIEHTVPKEIKTQNLTTLETRKVKIKYPFDFNPDYATNINIARGIRQMQSRNILNTIEQVVEVNGKVVDGQIFEYECEDRFMPKEIPLKRIKQLVTNHPLAAYTSYLSKRPIADKPVIDTCYKQVTNILQDYDNNIISIHKDNDVINSSMYQTGIQSPIADIVNGTPRITKVFYFTPDTPIYIKCNQYSPFTWDLPNSFKIVMIGVIKVTFEEGVDMNRQFEIIYPDKGQMVTKSVPAYFFIENYDGIPFYSMHQGDKIEIRVKDIGSNNITFRVELDYDYKLFEVIGDCFHTSFEDDKNATTLSRAKSGIKAWKNTYTLKLSELPAKDYVLMYWKSNDGETWEKVTEELSITSASPDKIIGATTYYIDEIRLLPKNARIKTRTFLPGIGVNSETDHNGNTIYYEYDMFGRLTKILDNDRNEIKRYEYMIMN